MKFPTSTSLLFLFTFISTLEACKCAGNTEGTIACCKSVGGSPSGDDCPANSISQRLSNFASCCGSLGQRSDCKCPVGCAKEELQAARKAVGLGALNDTEVLVALDGYVG
ncbi:hypothetical protein CJF32_00009909 [Rutstroemia sp. NJR-2017a WRK4]|nr:hypothetical protein CJF32_00009909 [Rutstroemia sp. NJR-2017a WRK4]